MKNKNQIAAIATATLFISAIPVSAIAASASVTLSNISITNTALDGGFGAGWDYPGYPYGGYNSSDSTRIFSDTTGNWFSPNNFFHETEIVEKDKWYSIDVTSFSAATSIPGSTGSGSVVVDPILRSLYEYADASEGYRSSYNTIESREYFHGSGLVEFNIYADYVLTSDPGDNSLFANSESYIKLTAFINGTPNLLFDRDMKFFSNTDPGMHAESGTISLKFAAPPGSFRGYFLWETGAVVGQIPEPSTYAMLLAGLGLMGFVGRRKA